MFHMTDKCGNMKGHEEIKTIETHYFEYVQAEREQEAEEAEEAKEVKKQKKSRSKIKIQNEKRAVKTTAPAKTDSPFPPLLVGVLSLSL